MGEEWRKGWHPETVPPRRGDDSFLIVGAGPTGLECARLLGRRGCPVHVAEAREELGGRVTLESRLPGLGAWARVRDYRLAQLAKLPHVEVFRDSRLDAGHILEFGASRVVLATGAHWRRDGVGRANPLPVAGCATSAVFTPDDLLAGVLPEGPVVVFDDDHYYLGGVLAELLRSAGREVMLVTPADKASAWTVNTLEQHAIQKRLLEIGVIILTNRNLVGVTPTAAMLACTYTGRREERACRSLVAVTSRIPNDELASTLAAMPEAVARAGILSVTSLGDCLAPGTIAAAVYAGHRYAREYDRPDNDAVAFRRELPGE
jgi:dimethylamine/trimethylamine dehydrogenase